MKFRIRQVPIETLELNKLYLNTIQAMGKTDREYNVAQGPCVLEFNDATYGKEGEWKEVEFSV
jgi:hypothetical protein